MELIEFLRVEYIFKHHTATVYKKLKGYAVEITQESGGKKTTYFVSVLDCPSLFQIESLINKYFKG